MATLQQFRDYHYSASQKVSDNTRTLALSAIGVVWFFKEQTDIGYVIPQGLAHSVLCVFLALACDFSQHVYGAVSWHIRFRIEEGKLAKGEIKEDTNNLMVSSRFNFPAYALFYSKIILIILAYYGLSAFLIEHINWEI